MLRGTRVTVERVAALHVFSGISLEEMAEDSPPEITLAKLHAALAYYFIHRSEMDEVDGVDASSVEERMANDEFAWTLHDTPEADSRHYLSRV